MPLSPGCGETPLDGEELDALLPAVREALGDNPTRAAVFDLEQTVQDEVAEELLTSVIEGSLAWDELLADYFVRELHRRPRRHRSHPPFHRWQRAHDATAGGPRVCRRPRHRHTRPVRLGPRQAPLHRPAARVRREPGSKRARQVRRGLADGVTHPPAPEVRAGPREENGRRWLIELRLPLTIAERHTFYDDRP